MTSFYFFAARSMAYFVGLWINSPSLTLSTLAIMCVFGVVLVVVVGKTIYDFHKNKLEDGVYEQ